MTHNGARASVRNNVLRRGVEIAISPAPGRMLNWNGGPLNEPVAEHIEPAAEHYLSLPDDVARALYEALHRFYGGTDVATLRDDLLVERARVDRLITAIIPDRPATVLSNKNGILNC